MRLTLPSTLLLIILTQTYTYAPPIPLPTPPPSFISKRILQNYNTNVNANDNNNDNNNNRIITRFPPEPNGPLHIGHGKSIFYNWFYSNHLIPHPQTQQGYMNLRLDDTNPLVETTEYARGIEEDVRWLLRPYTSIPFDGSVKRTSGYYRKILEVGKRLVEDGRGYVDFSTGAEIKLQKRTGDANSNSNSWVVNTPGKSPYRTHTTSQNLDYFDDMVEGEFKAGEACLRLIGNLTSGNRNLWDPVLYRILPLNNLSGSDDSGGGNEEMMLLPLYDFSHPISDVIEGVKWSICTLEFESHRPLYEMFVDFVFAEGEEFVTWLRDDDNVSEPPKRTSNSISKSNSKSNKASQKPTQLEFSRLKLTKTLTSKRLLKTLPLPPSDPRLKSTLSSLRRSGYPPQGLATFYSLHPPSKIDSGVDTGGIECGVLEGVVRGELDKVCERVMGVGFGRGFEDGSVASSGTSGSRDEGCRITTLIISTPNNQTKQQNEIIMQNHPKDANFGTRTIHTPYISPSNHHKVQVDKRDFKVGTRIKLKSYYEVEVTHVLDDGSVYGVIDVDSLGKSPDAGVSVVSWLGDGEVCEVDVRVYKRFDFDADDSDNGDDDDDDDDDDEEDSVKRTPKAFTINTTDTIKTYKINLESSILPKVTTHLNLVKSSSKQWNDYYTNDGPLPESSRIYKSDFRVQVERVGYFCLDDDCGDDDDDGGGGIVFNFVCGLRGKGKSTSENEGGKGKGKIRRRGVV